VDGAISQPQDVDVFRFEGKASRRERAGLALYRSVTLGARAAMAADAGCCASLCGSAAAVTLLEFAIRGRASPHQELRDALECLHRRHGTDGTLPAAFEAGG